MVDKQDGIWNYKTTTLPYDISQKRQIRKQTYCQEERKYKGTAYSSLDNLVWVSII